MNDDDYDKNNDNDNKNNKQNNARQSENLLFPVAYDSFLLHLEA